ncbi:MAG TPA: deoxyhypusine synthase [Thermoanaerobaculia bacterium]|nr:deoxyhypusine synthase [Thermoanaerobaculia bacterium]
MKTEIRRKSRFLSGRRIRPRPVTGGVSAADLVEKTFSAYNAARLREACALFVERMLEPDVTVGLSVTGALTPAGLGLSCLNPLLRAGFVDWVVSTGANVYHDVHHALGMPIHEGRPTFDDVALRDEGVIRIYDIVFPYEVLLDTDAFFRQLLALPEFRRPMSTAEFHWRAGGVLRRAMRRLGLGTDQSVLATARACDVPVYTSSPGDSSIGMNVARQALEGGAFSFDVSADVNETAAIVYGAKRRGGKSAVLILGGGSPKNFVLQTEPQIQEVLGIDEAGHDYFLQITDARPDTGGLSGATPAEAVSWGKIDPNRLPDTVVCYVDTTVALPLLTAYALARHRRRPLKRLFRRREELTGALTAAFHDARRGKGTSKRAPKDRVVQLQGTASKPHRGFRSHAAFGSAPGRKTPR